MSRKPIRENYDAIVDIAGKQPKHTGIAYALLKVTFSIDPHRGSMDLTDPRPLENDLRDPNLEPRFPAHSDFATGKSATDVAVLGSVMAKEGKPVSRRIASIEIGEVMKRVAVIGDRTVIYQDSRPPEISSPEPFVEMPIEICRAYGGIDERVLAAEDDPNRELALIGVDLPGLYPRNPFGVGYLCTADPLDAARLPNFEDPDDLLTNQRLIVSDPSLWWRQPIPCHLDWVPITNFPRSIYFARDAAPWFQPPDDQTLREVERGILPPNYRDKLVAHRLGHPPHPRFYQEASHGLTLDEPPFGARVRLEGFHANHDVLECQMPKAAPTIEMTIEGKSKRVEPDMTSVAFYPNDLEATITYMAAMEMPRVFIPGVHKHIPLSVRFGKDEPIHYETPTPMLERLKAAKKSNAEES